MMISVSTLGEPMTASFDPEVTRWPIDIFCATNNPDKKRHNSPFRFSLTIEQAEQLANDILNACREARGDVPDEDAADCIRCGRVVTGDGMYPAANGKVACKQCYDLGVALNNAG